MNLQLVRQPGPEVLLEDVGAAPNPDVLLAGGGPGLLGWIVASETDTPQLGMVHIYNGLVASGFNQRGAIAALRADDHAAGVAEWERRHDATMEQLAGLPAIPAHGGWSLLFNAEAAGTTAPDLSAVLLEHKVAATPMTAWGETVAPRHVRFVYSNEPVERLAALGERVRAAL